MFTGLVQDLGRVRSITHRGTVGSESALIEIESSLTSKVALGDSISVDGVCLTATAVTPTSFTADVMIQTLRLTSLSSIEVGDGVNLELARAVDERLGGHIVQGHVDGVEEVLAL